jgi:N-acetylglucosamine malate deacetylase 1
MLDMLVIAPHPDDAELGMGGTILRFIQQGLKVGVLDLTSGEPTPYGSLELRAKETAAATKALKIEWRENLGLPNRSLEANLESRKKLAEVFRRTRPKWLFAPYWVDAHPDHVAATQLVEAARFWSKLTKTDMAGEPFHPARIFYYWCVHLRIIAEPTFVVDISEQWDAKRASLECYASQFITNRSTEPPTVIDRTRDQAAYWGWSIGTRYGEPFWSREPVGVTSMRDFV